MEAGRLRPDPVFGLSAGVVEDSRCRRCLYGTRCLRPGCYYGTGSDAFRRGFAAQFKRAQPPQR